MAIKMIDKQYCDCIDDYRYTFIMDADSDSANLPSCCVGSIAIVANEGGSIYITNTEGKWRKQ